MRLCSQPGDGKSNEQVINIPIHNSKFEHVLYGASGSSKGPCAEHDSYIRIANIDLNFNILTVNQLSDKQLKNTPKSIIGRKCFTAFEKRNSVCPNCPGSKTIATDKSCISKHKKYRGGGFDWIHIQTFPSFQQDGVMTGFIEISEIVPLKNKPESDLLESEEYFHNIFENTPIGLYRTTPDGKILIANPAIVKMLGYSSFEELACQNLETEEFPSEYPRSVFKEQIETNGQVNNFESVWLKPDGSKIFIRESAKAIRNDTGKTLYYEGTVIDITEHKLAEQKLIEDRMQLKSLASQLSLAEEREKHRLATELHDQIGQSLVISKIMLAKIRNSRTSGEIGSLLAEVSNCIDKIIQDTRTLTFDLCSPILYELGLEAAIAEWLSSQIQRKYGIETVFEDDGQPKPLRQDICTILFRNVRELLMNIIKHSQARNVKVSIHKKSQNILISVVDDGIGFNPTKVMSTAANMTTFGLFSIRERLDLLGGQMKIDSQPDCGCRITMTAPLKLKKNRPD